MSQTISLQMKTSGEVKRMIREGGRGGYHQKANVIYTHLEILTQAASLQIQTSGKERKEVQY